MNLINFFFAGMILFFIYGCENGNENLIEASGNIEAINVTISAKGSGEIKEILKDEGEEVKVGDTLMLIDHELSDYQLAQAQAQVDAAQAQVNLLKSGARKEDKAQAQNSVAQAKINLESAQNDFKRFSNLYESKVITKKQFEDAKARLDISENQFHSAQENLNKVNNLARPEEIKQAEANLNRAKANLDLIKKNIKDSYINSPVNGIIVKKFAEKGETVSPASSLFRISNLKIVELTIYVSEKELGKVKLGQKVKINVDAFPEKDFAGEVIYISPEAEFTPKNIQTKDERTKLVFEVKVQVPNPNYELKAGMPADATIDLNEN